MVLLDFGRRKRSICFLMSTLSGTYLKIIERNHAQSRGNIISGDRFTQLEIWCFITRYIHYMHLICLPRGEPVLGLTLLTSLESLYSGIALNAKYQSKFSVNTTNHFIPSIQSNHTAVLNGTFINGNYNYLRANAEVSNEIYITVAAT